MDLDTQLEMLEIAELRRVSKKVEKLIEGYEDRKMREALAAAEEAARAHGYSLSELSDAKKKSGSKVAPKYAHPENAELTWTGRGRQPRWIKELIEAGSNLEDLKIN